jgi:hypothetical protein
MDTVGRQARRLFHAFRVLEQNENIANFSGGIEGIHSNQEERLNVDYRAGKWPQEEFATMT